MNTYKFGDSYNMSTVAIQHNDGRIEVVYSHYDNDINSNGLTLQEFYYDRDTLKELISGGDICYLGKTKESTLYYYDEHQNHSHPLMFDSLEDYESRLTRRGYDYIFTQDDVWSVFYDGDYHDLEYLIQENNVSKTKVN